MNYTVSRNEFQGWLLAGLQVGLLTWLTLGTALRPPRPWTIGLLLVAVALGLWALRHLRLRQLRVTPAPARNARLVQTGPYARMRHPMYIAVLLFVAALLIHDPSPSRFAAAGALVAVLAAKVRCEEAALSQRFADYAVYAQRTGRFFPRFRQSSPPSNSR